MKILFLCTYYHRAMIFYDAMERLKSLGHEVTVFNAILNGEIVHDKYKDIMTPDIVHQECFSRWDRFFYFRKQKKFFERLIKNVNITQFDLIHSHNLFNGGYAARKISKQYNIPYVVSIRNTDINVYMKFPFFKTIANKIIFDASGVQFLSNPYKDNFIKNYISTSRKQEAYEKSIVIKNGLEDFWLENINNPKTMQNKKNLKIICVGKIDKNKNIETAAKSIEILLNRGYKVTFTVVGQVVDKSILKNLKKYSFVNIISYLTKEELIEVYRQNDIYLMPSIAETFGRVYAEAMTQGLPVVYSKGQGFDGIFENAKVGYAVPSMDMEVIANSLEKIVNNYKSISKACVENVEIFNWDRISKEIDTFYTKSVKGYKLSKK